MAASAWTTTKTSGGTSSIHTTKSEIFEAYCTMQWATLLPSLLECSKLRVKDGKLLATSEVWWHGAPFSHVYGSYNEFN